MDASSRTIRVEHQGGDRLLIKTRGHEIRSDQPVEDGGEDTAPTPTELFVAGLAGCVAFYAGRFLQRNNLTTDGLAVICRYEWAENPHRVGEVILDVEAKGLTAQRLEAFLRVIEHCTLHNTLLKPPSVRINVAPVQVAAARSGA